MDIKLKNRARFFLRIAIIISILFGCIMTLNYNNMFNRINAYIEERNKDGEINRYCASSFSEEFINANYSIWKDIIEEKNDKIKLAEDIFIKKGYDTTDEYYAEAVYYINSKAMYWDRAFNNVKNDIYYEVFIDGNKIKEYTGSDFILSKDNVSVDISYNNSGLLNVLSVDSGLEKNDTIVSTAILNSLEEYNHYNPLYNFHNQNTKNESYIEFNGPKNIVYKYKVNSGLVYDRDRYGYDTSYFFGDSHTMYPLLILLTICIWILALIFMLIRAVDLSKCFIFKLPIEFAILSYAICAAIILDGLAEEFIILSVTGKITSFFISMGIEAELSEYIMLSVNSLLWGIYFFIMFWGAAGAFSVFRLGIIKFIKEKTIPGLIYKYAKLYFNRYYERLKKIDFSKSMLKDIIKFMLINFTVLFILSLLRLYNIVTLIIYSVILFIFIKKLYDTYSNSYKAALLSLDDMASGNFDINLDRDFGIFNAIKERLQVINEGFKRAVEKEIVSEKMKTELITNVSHDLKTPLTAIITYVNLLKDKNISEEERGKYIEVLDNKSLRLRALIEDLFEVSNINSGNIELNKNEIDIVSIIKEVRVDLEEEILSSNIDFRWNLPDSKLILELDGQKTYRALENLVINIVKHGMENTRAYINAEMIDNNVVITMKNISKNEIHMSVDKLLERFVKEDGSRAEKGHGLGLAIAQSLIEIQGGIFNIYVDGDLFTATIEFKSYTKEGLD